MWPAYRISQIISSSKKKTVFFLSLLIRRPSTRQPANPYPRYTCVERAHIKFAFYSISGGFEHIGTSSLLSLSHTHTRSHTFWTLRVEAGWVRGENGYQNKTISRGREFLKSYQRHCHCELRRRRRRSETCITHAIRCHLAPRHLPAAAAGAPRILVVVIKKNWKGGRVFDILSCMAVLKVDIIFGGRQQPTTANRMWGNVIALLGACTPRTLLFLLTAIAVTQFSYSAYLMSNFRGSEWSTESFRMRGQRLQGSIFMLALS